MNNNQFYQAILDGFVSEGWVTCVATDEGYAYYAIGSAASTVQLMLANEAAASIAIDNDDEVGTFSLE